LLGCSFEDVESRPYVEFDTDRGSALVFVEIADEYAERVQGLRNRSYLAPQQGMWFVFDEPEKKVFTMKDVLIPLDMIFVDENFMVTEIYANRQPSTVEALTYSEFPAQYVLELYGGRAEELSLKVGDVMVPNF
jgi:uncharacterized protein